MIIGVPREIKTQEYRVALEPAGEQTALPNRMPIGMWKLNYLDSLRWKMP